jgi:hypothetical protein
MISDPFDLGMISPDDIKNEFGALVQKVQYMNARSDLIMEAIDDAKASLIDRCARNLELFEIKRRGK